jgi:methylated-DNA-[protein]-cysteine S-methyltransferase
MTQPEALERELRRAAAAVDSSAPEFAGAADAAGLLDVVYTTTDSPVGTLLLAATPAGLVRIAYTDFEDQDAVLAELAERVSPRVLAVPRKLDRSRRELDQYFAGGRHTFDVPIDWQLTKGFARRVLEATAEIPYGEIASYRDVASLAGSPRGFRAAGNALGSNPIPIVVPCHRVLHTGGGLGGYTGGLDRKRTLLAIERGQAPLATGL